MYFKEMFGHGVPIVWGKPSACMYVLCMFKVILLKHFSVSIAKKKAKVETVTY